MINSSSYRTYYIKTLTNLTDTHQPGAPVNYWRLFLQLTKNNWLTYFIHAITWVSLYFLPVIVLSVFNVKPFSSFFEPANPAYLLSYALVIIFSYLNYHWLVPVFFIAKKRIIYFLMTAGFIAVIGGLQSFTTISLSRLQTVFTGLNYTFLLLIVSVFTSIIIQQEDSAAEAEKEISKMKMASLNNQINPHFLFNSLNWIYLLAVTESDETADAIIQLSGMMRHIMQSSNTDFIDLKKELVYIKDYIALQKGRLGNTISLTSSIQLYKGTGKIAPLLLLSFIENAFKHGVNPEEDSAISINIAVSNNMLCAEIINNKVSLTEKKPGAGIGIKNAEQRLKLLYPSTHQLEILEDDKIYSVKLLMKIL